MLHDVNVALFYLSLLMFDYFNVALFDVALINVVYLDITLLRSHYICKVIQNPP